MWLPISTGSKGVEWPASSPAQGTGPSNPSSPGTPCALAQSPTYELLSIFVRFDSLRFKG